MQYFFRRNREKFLFITFFSIFAFTAKYYFYAPTPPYTHLPSQLGAGPCKQNDTHHKGLPGKELPGNSGIWRGATRGTQK